MKKVPLKYIWKCMIYHTPKEMLSVEQRKDIVRNGLVHFTKSNAVASIMENGLMYNSSRAMKRAEKKMVWAYIYDPEDPKKNLEVIRSKGDRSSTDAMIIIKGISEEQLNNMRCRPKLDDAIAHIGNLKTADMTYEIF